ncbi:MAG: hypothetical protein ACFCBV_12820 [Phycisphaerales bacterium]
MGPSRHRSGRVSIRPKGRRAARSRLRTSIVTAAWTSSRFPKARTGPSSCMARASTRSWPVNQPTPVASNPATSRSETSMLMGSPMSLWPESASRLC